MIKPVLNRDKTRRITMKYGYARVSTHDQNLARQIKILTDLQVDRIYQEKALGANLDRPILNQIISKIKEGDELVVTSLDRLSRDADDTTKLIVKLSLRGARLRALDVPSFEEVENQNIKRLLSSMLVEVKKFLASEERNKILERQRQGIDLALQRGVYKGRPILFGPNVKDKRRRAVYFEIKQLLEQGESMYAIRKKTGKSNTLIQRIKNELD